MTHDTNESEPALLYVSSKLLHSLITGDRFPLNIGLKCSSNPTNVMSPNEIEFVRFPRTPNVAHSGFEGVT